MSSTRQELIPNLSRALSLIFAQERAAQECHADVEAFGAPSECHRDVERGNQRAMREVEIRCRLMTGAPLPAMWAEAQRRATRKSLYKALDRIIAASDFLARF